MARLFLAINFSQEVIAELAAACSKIRQGWGDELKVSKQEHLHLTLKFLGETESEKASELERELASALAPHESFDIRLGSIGSFPEHRPARIVWAGLQAQGLACLQKEIEDTTELLGFPRENRPFTPHVTLARCKEGLSEKRTQALIERVVVSPKSCTIREVILFESKLSSSGPLYTVVREFRLR